MIYKDTYNKELPEKTKMALFWIISILKKKNVKYHICGGLCARFYGSNRRINDIDIDIKEQDFIKMYNHISSYVIFGPKLYIDNKWKVLLMIIKYNNQIIEFANATNIQIYNTKRSRWISFKYNLTDFILMKWKKISIKLMNPRKMIVYKKYLDGNKQKKDIKAIKQYIHENNF